MASNKSPLGIELVRRGVVTQEDVAKAIEYQQRNPKEKIGDILYKLNLADPERLLQAMGEILEEKTIMLKSSDIKLNVTNYISLDTAKEDLAVPFEISNGAIRVCFASTANRNQIEAVRLLMLNKGLIMETYISFKEFITFLANINISLHVTSSISIISL